jgi:malate synthase
MARDLRLNYVRIGSLSVAKALDEFIEREAAPGTSISAEAFWSGFAELLRDCGTRNRQLLEVRDELQSRIDQYHRERSGEPLDLGDYERFLRDIGYVLPEGNDFAIRTTNIDDEIAVVAGPQLVVPLSNARYALNAANARWGSLYDALYGTDAIPEDGGATRTGTYNKIRGERVVARGRAMLDETVPLARGSHRDVVSYSVEGANLLVRLRDGTSTGLARLAQFAGYRGEASAPSAVLLRNHGLHLEIKIDRGGLVGRDDPAGIADIVLESAVTTIMDLEDSVAAVDAEDKVAVYLARLQTMQSFHQDEAFAVLPHQDRALQANLQDALGDLLRLLGIERRAPLHRHVDVGDRKCLAFHHGRRPARRVRLLIAADP